MKAGTITKKGKTFTQHFWIKPSEVKDTDQVVLNKQNLPQGHSKRPDDVANPHSPRKYDDPIKQKTQDYFFSFKNVGECLAALITCGSPFIDYNRVHFAYTVNSQTGEVTVSDWWVKFN